MASTPRLVNTSARPAPAQTELEKWAPNGARWVYSVKEELNTDLPDDLPTNGFLLLNYGNYGHLLLAWDPVRKYRYLGVPGIFDNEKSFISKLFGFQEFITVPIRPHKTGNFGYFMLPVQ